MGNGIAVVCAQAAVPVFMVDIRVDILNRTIKNIGGWMGKFNEKGKATESLETIMEVVEVIKGIETPEEAMQAGVDFVCKNRMRYRNLIFETKRTDR